MRHELRLDITLGAGNALVCDLYAIPSDAPPDGVLLTLRLRTCDKLTSPAQIYRDCFANGHRGLVEAFGAGGFHLMATLDDDGNATLLVPPGRYTAINGPGHNVGGTHRYCLQAGKPETGTEEVGWMAAGEIWICDFYVRFETFR